jgi:hypothetical protein
MTQTATLPAWKSQKWQQDGVQLEGNTITVDLAEPRTIHVQGVNARTGETKDYLLKVTQSGKLALI